MTAQTQLSHDTIKSNENVKQPKEKAKGGRPPKRIKRDQVIVVRLTQTEQLLIAGKAKQAKMRLSDWFRKAAKSANVLARISTEEASLLRMLTGTANNLNQLTRRAHQEGLLSVAKECINLMAAIDQTLKYLNQDDRKSNER